MNVYKYYTMITKYSQIRHTLPYIGFCGGLSALAVAMLPVSTLGFELPKLVVLSVLCLGCALSLFLRKTDVLSPLMQTLPGRLYLGFAVVLILSILWSIAPAISLLGAAPRYQGILTHLLYLLLGLFVADSMRHAKGRKLIVSALICANAVTVFYGVLQMLHLDPLADIWKLEIFLGRVFSGLGHPNTLGQFILLTIPFVSLQWLRSLESVRRLLWGILLMLNGVVLLGTVSRSAMLGALVLLLLCIPAFRIWMKSRVRTIKTEQAFVISLIVVLCTSIGLLFFAQRFTQTFSSGRSLSSRGVMWESTFDMVRERPFGWGLETMAFASPQFTGKSLYKYESLTTTVDRAHNEPLHILMTLGPLGFIVYVALVVTLLLAAWRHREKDDSGLLRATAAGILGYQVAVFFGFPSIATAAFFWILIGMLLSFLSFTYAPVKLRGVRIINIGFLALATVTLVVAIRWTQARLIHAQAQNVLSKDPSMAIALHQQGVVMFTYDRQSIMNAAEVHLLALEKEDVEYREDLLSSTQVLIGLMKNATSHRDGMAFLLEAWFFAVQGDRENTDTALAQAKILLPTSFVFHRTALHIADIFGDGVLAEQHRMGIRGLLPDGYFEEESELRRILLKQHPWLKEITS